MALSFQRFLRIFRPKTLNLLFNSCYCSWHSVSDILKTVDVPKTVIQVKGWVKGSRKMKELIFVDVNDGSCADKLQVVISKQLKPENLTFGSSLEVDGKLRINTNNNTVELIAESVRVIGTCDPTSGYPFAARKTYPDEYVRQFLHLRPRHSTFACVMRLRDAVTRGLHDVLGKCKFVMVHTPIVTSNDCEGAGEVFLVTPHSCELKKVMAKEGLSPEQAYFNTLAYLTVSGQLHLEAAVRGLSKVYSFGPVFRAENSRSRLHLSEFYMLEAELAFSENLEDAMKVVENLIKGAATRLLDTSVDDLVFLQKQTSTNIMESLESVSSARSLPRLSYSEAISLLGQEKCDVRPPQLGENLNKEHELLLSSIVAKQSGLPFVFITDWPAHLKPFYMKLGEHKQALAFDLIGPVAGEVCGGSVREPNPVVLEQRLLKLELGSKETLTALQWYLDIRRHGNVPTSGFGLGFERILQSLLGILNIKDTLPFPRWPHNLKM